MKTEAKPKRAVKGTITSALLVRLSTDLQAKITKAAEKAGLSKAEWVRQTIEWRLR